MQFHLAAIGRRMPPWVQAAYEDYSKRFPPHIRWSLTEINTPKRHKNQNIAQCMALESDELLKAADQAYVVALDKGGKEFSTKELANLLQQWQEYPQLCFMIGGPDGLAAPVLERANLTWSLSPLTFPHALARIVVIEQIYRAWSLNQGHPYHR